MVTDLVTVQALASVTLTEYVPAISVGSTEVVGPLDQV